MKKQLLTALVALTFCGALVAQESPLTAGKVSADNGVWITMGEDLFGELARSQGILKHSAFGLKAYESDNGVVMTRLVSADLPAVSEFFHTKAMRCPGFIAHTTQAEASKALQSMNRVAFKALPVALAIDQQTTVNGMIGSLSQANILSTITHLSTQYTNRYYTYTSGQQSALWIRDLWAGYGGSRSDVNVTTYTHNFAQPSVIMTVTGTTYPSEIVVIGGHLDSIRSGGMSTNTSAPGADDNASGIATISEVIRVLMANGFAPERTVKFMGYAAEEVGLVGSGEIAADHAAANETVVGVMQLDMTAFNGSVEDIVLMDDYTSADLNAFIGDLIDEYQPSASWTYSTCGYGCSDHASWTNNGFPASIPFEARMGQHNSAIHTTSDTTSTFGNSAAHSIKFARTALSFAIEAGSGGGGTPPPPPPPPPAGVLSNGVPETGLSASTGGDLNYLLSVPSGSTNLVFTTTGSNGDADLYVRFGSTPTTSVNDCQSTSSNSNESCSFASPQVGDYYVLVDAYSAFSNLALEGSFDDGTSPPPPPPPPPSCAPSGASCAGNSDCCSNKCRGKGGNKTCR